MLIYLVGYYYDDIGYKIVMAFADEQRAKDFCDTDENFVIHEQQVDMAVENAGE